MGKKAKLHSTFLNHWDLQSSKKFDLAQLEGSFLTPKCVLGYVMAYEVKKIIEYFEVQFEPLNVRI